MPYTNPGLAQDPTTGVAIATAWGDQVNTDLQALALKPAIRVAMLGTLTIANDTLTKLTSSVAGETKYDPHGMHDPTTNPSRFTVPAGWAGVWDIRAHGTWQLNNVGRRAWSIILNNVTTLVVDDRNPVATTGECGQGISTEYDLAVGDYIELAAYQNSGGNLQIQALHDYSPRLMMHWVRALPSQGAG